MREIKFRAWVEGSDILGRIRMPYMATQGDPDIETFDSFMFHYRDEKNLMQFTGLKDKNGKEIYEGDICRHNFTVECLGESETHEMVSVVEWRNNVSAFMFVARDKNSMQVNTITGKEGEVVGNIYENPELQNRTN